MHDTSKKTQIINQIEAVGCCARCKDVLDWKIKYKKYKPLTVAKKCTTCSMKRIKRAYYILCDECMKSTNKCGKCGQSKELAMGLGASEREEAQKKAALEQELKMLPERKRRTFLRLQESGKLDDLGCEGAEGKAPDDESDLESDIESDDVDNLSDDNVENDDGKLPGSDKIDDPKDDAIKDAKKVEFAIKDMKVSDIIEDEGNENISDFDESEGELSEDDDGDT